MDRIINVLVVDDNEAFAAECVDFLREVCNVGAEMALTAEDAEDKLKELPIKIILLDYDMPVNGLDLFPRLKNIDKSVEIIFITAVASKEIVFESEKYPFAARIEKVNCNQRLQELIPILLMKYDRENIKIYGKLFFTDKKGGLFRKDKIEYYIHSYTIIDDQYTFPDSWHTTQMVQAGEKLQHTEKLDYEKMFNFQDNFKFHADYELGFGGEELIKLQASLAAYLESQIKNEYSEKMSVAISRMRELSLPSIEKTGEASIVSRFYDFANVYYKIKFKIIRHCSCCNSDTILLTTVYYPIPKVAYRIREYYDGKEPKEIKSGLYETGFQPARLI